MEVQIISRRRKFCGITLKLTDGSVLRGKVNLYYEETPLNRVSDLFTQHRDPFLVVFDVTLDEKTGQVFIINKQQIIWITPDD